MLKLKIGELVNTPAGAVVVDGSLADWTTSAAPIGRHEHLVVSDVVAPNTIRRGGQLLFNHTPPDALALMMSWINRYINQSTLIHGT